MTKHDSIEQRVADLGAFELLEEAIARSGLSARKFAELLWVDERTVRYWLAESREIPGPVRLLCAAIMEDPGFAHRLVELGQTYWEARQPKRSRK